MLSWLPGLLSNPWKMRVHSLLKGMIYAETSWPREVESS